MGNVNYDHQVQKYISEMNQLLDLAEEISAKVEAANDHVSRQTMSIFGIITIFTVGASLASSIQRITSPSPDRDIFLYGLLFASVVIAVFLASIFVKMTRRRREIDVERRILGDLADMISSLFHTIDPDITAVDRALLTMRMRRISLSLVRDRDFEGRHPFSPR